MSEESPPPDGARASAGEARARFRAGAGRPPFAHLRPVFAAAAAYAVAAVAWGAAGGALPGGRWAAVHLFTLGTLSNLVAAMTDHFGRTLTRAAGDGRTGIRLLVLNAGALLTLVGLVTGAAIAVGTGAALAAVAVAWLWVALRRMRTAAVNQRFGYALRAYEHASLAFVAGAALGGLLGTGALPGEWYVAVRLAHLSVTVLGWGGLVLLATLVFWAPTMMRTQMLPGADRLAITALRGAALSLGLATLALAGTAAPGIPGLAATIFSTAGIGAYAVATTAICVPVLRAARRAVPSPHAWMIAAASVWFPIIGLAGAGVVAAGRQELLDALGLLLITGVLGQAIVASMAYLLPMVTGAGPAARTAARRQLDRWPITRTAAWNLAVVALGAGVALPRLGGPEASATVAVGWFLLAASLGAHAGLVAAALRDGRHAAAESAPQHRPTR